MDTNTKYYAIVWYFGQIVIYVMMMFIYKNIWFMFQAPYYEYTNLMETIIPSNSIKFLNPISPPKIYQLATKEKEKGIIQLSRTTFFFSFLKGFLSYRRLRGSTVTQWLRFKGFYTQAWGSNPRLYNLLQIALYRRFRFQFPEKATY